MNNQGDIFSKLKEINLLLESNEPSKARDELIQLLDVIECRDINIERRDIKYDFLINHLIRKVGLFPYLKVENAFWQDKFVHDAFKVDIGSDELVTLHLEQSNILKSLLDGKDLALIAPTSFGKSFIIDAFIQIKKPNNVMIIVPTIALTDETRRRLHPKFSNEYKIITTSDVDVVKSDNKNIFIFPQERALTYIDTIQSLDILIIDEFYKASSNFDKERSVSLQSVILKFAKIAKQRYFLAPNISNITKNNLLTEKMEIKNIDFKTVFLNTHKTYEEIKKNKEINGKDTKNDDTKKSYLLKILNATKDKSLIFAGTYPEIKNISKFLVRNLEKVDANLLCVFAEWVSKNYSSSWYLVKLIKRETGIHNGRIHRSLSQIQIQLFSENDGLKNIISTSSIIEGVNTSAKNVILWKNKNGPKNLDCFGYKNLSGRAGRMLKHFIGDIYLLEKPPKEEDIQLTLDISKELIDDSDSDLEAEHDNIKVQEIKNFHADMSNKLGIGTYKKLKNEKFFESYNWQTIETLIDDMQTNPNEWNGLAHLNASSPQNWKDCLYKILKIFKIRLDMPHNKVIELISLISKNWDRPTSQIINKIKENDNVDIFFKIEKWISFNLSNSISCINILQKEIFPENRCDISSFATRATYVFLPKNVYLLEEYGLPRMISKKIQDARIPELDLETDKNTLHQVLDNFNKIGIEVIFEKVNNLDYFDKYILKHFYEGISKFTDTL